MTSTPPHARLGLGAPDHRRESTERRILDAAAALITEGGAWNGLGIRQIAERAAISRTAFYDFFASKNEVLEQLVAGLHDDLATLLTEPDEGGALPLHFSQLRPSLTRLAAYSAAHGAIYVAFVDASSEDARLAALFGELTRVYADLLVPVIDTARAEHPAAPRTPEAGELARVLLAMTERTMLMLLRTPTAVTDPGELLEALAQVWERAVLGGVPGPVAG